MAPGGSVSNTGLALHILGINTRLIGRIGDDSFGAELCSLLEAFDSGLTSDMRLSPGEDTSYTIILSPPDADRVFLHDYGANDTFCADDVDYDALDSADLFHFGYPTVMAGMQKDNGEELANLYRRAKRTGTTTSLDTSMFDRHGPARETDWAQLLARTLPFVDIILPSLDEMLLMLDPGKWPSGPDPVLCRDIAGSLLDWGAKVVVIKRGRHGLYLRTKENLAGEEMGRAFAGDLNAWAGRELWAPSFQVEFVGATGAGDCAVGGFLAALLRGFPPEQALMTSAAAGACNVEAADAISGIRTWKDTQARIRSGWAQNEITLPGWSYDPRARLWISPHDSRPAL